MIKLMKLDGSSVLVEPRTIQRVERDGTVTRIHAGVGADLLVMESPDEVMLKIEAATVRPGRVERPDIRPDLEDLAT